MTDNLSQLLAAPLRPPRAQRRPAARAGLLSAARADPQGDASAMEDLAGLQAVQQAAAEAALSA